MMDSAEALIRMRKIDLECEDDTEGWHILADEFLLEALETGATLAAVQEIKTWFNGTGKWYS